MRATAPGRLVLGKTVIQVWYVDDPADLAGVNDSAEGDVAICVSGPIYRRDISVGGWVLKFDPTVGVGSAAWGGITGTLADQPDLTSALDGKAAVSHTHAQGDVTNLTTDLAGKAPLVHTHAATDIMSAFSTRSDTFTTTGNGTTVDATAYPLSLFGMEVKGTGASATTWDVRLEGSMDGTNFTQILQHTNTIGDGICQYSGSLFSPSKYFRSRCAGLVLGSATNIVVTILGIGG